MKYTEKELDNAAIDDLLNDARTAKLQAKEGPFYPEKGITPKSLRSYAAKCLLQAKKYRKGGAHKAVLFSKNPKLRPPSLRSGVARVTRAKRNPKKGNFYVSTYCNHPHNIKTGKPIRHECRIIPPAALRAEMAGDYETAVEIMQGKKPRMSWLKYNPRGKKGTGFARNKAEAKRRGENLYKTYPKKTNAFSATKIKLVALIKGREKLPPATISALADAAIAAAKQIAPKPYRAKIGNTPFILQLRPGQF